MYTLAAYGAMLTDEARTAAYVAALAQAVKPGDVVVDLGAGTGFFALVACQLGARRVYAVELDDAIHVARACAQANGCHERITFIQDDARRVVLPEPANVIVSDLRGVLPYFQGHLPILADVQRRWLAPGGVLLPRQDDLFATLVSAPRLHDQLTQPWRSGPRGLDLRPVLRHATSTWLRAELDPEQLLASPVRWQRLNYHGVHRWDVEAELVLEAGRAATGHGLAIWFDAELLPGVGFSNAPGRKEAVYGQAFFPWPEAMALQAGDRAEVQLRAQLVNADYVWRWRTTLRRRQNVLAAWDQSTFFAEPLGRERLRRMTREARPVLALEGRVLGFVLNRLDGLTTLDDLARELVAAFPEVFASVDEAWHRVCQVAGEHGR